MLFHLSGVIERDLRDRAAPTLGGVGVAESDVAHTALITAVVKGIDMNGGFILTRGDVGNRSSLGIVGNDLPALTVGADLKNVVLEDTEGEISSQHTRDVEHINDLTITVTEAKAIRRSSCIEGDELKILVCIGGLDRTTIGTNTGFGIGRDQIFLFFRRAAALDGILNIGGVVHTVQAVGRCGNLIRIPLGLNQMTDREGGNGTAKAADGLGVAKADIHDVVKVVIGGIDRKDLGIGTVDNAVARASLRVVGNDGPILLVSGHLKNVVLADMEAEERRVVIPQIELIDQLKRIVAETNAVVGSCRGFGLDKISVFVVVLVGLVGFLNKNLGGYPEIDLFVAQVTVRVTDSWLPSILMRQESESLSQK